MDRILLNDNIVKTERNVKEKMDPTLEIGAKLNLYIETKV